MAYAGDVSNQASILPDLHVVMPAGGPGTRLWPLSRTLRPKFLLDLTGTGRSLLQQTWDRLSALADGSRLYVVTGSQHAEAVCAQLPDLRAANLVEELSPLDTAPAIGLAAAIIARRSEDAVVGSFPADHLVRNVDEFHRAVGDAVAAARLGYVVTLGIRPTRPATGFGYIKTGARVADSPSALLVPRFVEKPEIEVAERYLREGDWLWNSGMFVVRADVILAELRRHRPKLVEGLETIAAAWDTPRRSEVINSTWPTLEKISIDHAVAEPSALDGRVAVVPTSLEWDDIGDWAALVSLLAPDGGMTPAVIGDVARVLATESSGLVVAEGRRQVRIHGLDDIVVVDTPDVLFVTTTDRAQEVKRLVEHLRANGQSDLL
jgi:mannose-1-phosphate guanylyltransferase